MDLLAIALTVVAGLAMGWINNVAGGAGVFAFWALEYACGLPLAATNPSTRVAAVAVGAFAFLGYSRAGQRVRPEAWLQGLLAVPGAVVGSEIALAAPPVALRVYLAALMVLLLRQQLRPVDPDAPATTRSRLATALGCLLIGAHMGFVQIGTGLVATLVLAHAYRRDLVAVNVAKSTIVILTSIASVGTFAAADAIAWGPALWLAAGAGAGSYAASHWSVRRGSHAVRRVVVAIAVLTLTEQLVHLALALAPPPAR
jgi:uncharacterized membrane protein YfcA